MKRKGWKDQYKSLGGQSGFHTEVQDIFCKAMPFKNWGCYQEVAVVDLCPAYSKRNEHFDWFIEDLNLVIELHGQQHYKVVNFGNKDGDTAVRDLTKIQTRDSNKQVAAEGEGYSYLAIPYTERKNLTAEKLWAMIEEVL